MKKEIVRHVNRFIGLAIALLGIGLTGCKQVEPVELPESGEPIDTLMHPMYGVPPVEFMTNE